MKDFMVAQPITGNHPIHPLPSWVGNGEIPLFNPVIFWKIPRFYLGSGIISLVALGIQLKIEELRVGRKPVP